ncbi:MAG: hypothetical protein ACRDTG_16330 [Pseudonocardiaceae bacterium]
MSPYENAQKTVDEVILALTKFVDRDYPQAGLGVWEFINLVHTTIETAIDAVHQTQQGYLQAEDLVADRLRGVYPN